MEPKRKLYTPPDRKAEYWEAQRVVEVDPGPGIEADTGATDREEVPMTPLVIVLWGYLALLAYGGVWKLTAWALRPKFTTVDPDWFYQGGSWTRSDQPGVVHGQYESFKPEPSDPPASKPESGAG